MATLNTRLVCAGLAVCCGLLSPAAQGQDVLFVRPRNLPGTLETDAVAVGDFNGDGLLDLAVANQGSTDIQGSEIVLVFLGNGDGTFQDPLTLTAQSHPSSVAVGDFNGDGVQDLAVTNALSATVSV